MYARTANAVVANKIVPKIMALAMVVMGATNDGSVAFMTVVRN